MLVAARLASPGTSEARWSAAQKDSERPPEGQRTAGREGAHRGDRGVTDAALGHVEDAVEGDLVGRVGQQP